MEPENQTPKAEPLKEPELTGSVVIESAKETEPEDNASKMSPGPMPLPQPGVTNSVRST